MLHVLTEDEDDVTSLELPVNRFTLLLILLLLYDVNTVVMVTRHHTITMTTTTLTFPLINYTVVMVTVIIRIRGNPLLG